MISLIKQFLEHPLTKGLSVDDPKTTLLRRQIIRQKKFLYRLYSDWYRMIEEQLPDIPGGVVELGAGAGFMKDILPFVITTEVLSLPGIDVLISPDKPLPFAEGQLRAIVMTDVLHHISAPRSFFAEATRTVKPGGVVVMIEPWVTAWSTFVYTRMHAEPFRTDAREWEFPEKGPLSGANGALPWMMFARDRQIFEQQFPAWQIDFVKPIMPFSYLVSGGVSMRALLPGWMYRCIRVLESLCEPKAAMFAMIKLTRQA
jgi:SAM-dependent methyltransferase